MPNKSSAQIAFESALDAFIRADAEYESAVAAAQPYKDAVRDKESKRSECWTGLNRAKTQEILNSGNSMFSHEGEVYFMRGERLFKVSGRGEIYEQKITAKLPDFPDAE